MQSIYLSYFYVIRDTQTNELYAGCRFADGCYPEEFMKSWGYQTSSEKVLERIEESGLERFEVLKLKTFEGKFEAPIYEKRFLKKVRAPFNSRFLNENYGGYCKSTPNSQVKRLESQANSFQEKYGVSTVSHVPGVLERRNATRKKVMLEKYGVDNISKTDYFKEVKRKSAQKLNEREIVKMIRATGAKLGSGWWQKDTETLEKIYRDLV